VRVDEAATRVVVVEDVMQELLFLRM